VFSSSKMIFCSLAEARVAFVVTASIYRMEGVLPCGHDHMNALSFV
jgi:hypothetical protein